MTSRDFCYWLRGITEINEDFYPSKEQWEQIQAHLKLVFVDEAASFLDTPVYPINQDIHFIDTPEPTC